MTISGTAGNDNLIGTSGDDTFDLRQGGDDTAQGLGGNDLFLFASTFTAADSIDGGTGADVLRLAGDYSAGITFGAVVNIHTIQVNAGDSYDLTTTDANVAAGAILKIDAHTLGAGDSLAFDGAAESDGRFQITGGAGNDSLTGGGGNDLFILTGGGIDSVNGGGGDDTVQMGATLAAASRIDGGTGNDTVQLAGDYTGAHAVVFNATTMTNVKTLQLAAGNSYTLTTADETVAAGAILTVDASALGAGDALTFDSTAETDGFVDVIGGAGDDHINGGRGGDGEPFGPPGDIFDLSQGGNDTATGNGSFLMGATLTAQDTITGTGDLDAVVLDGDYSAGLVLGARTITDIRTVVLTAGHSYSITENNGNVAAGGQMEFYGFPLGAGDNITIDGAAETDGSLTMIAGAGTNIFTGGRGDDTFSAPAPDVRSVAHGGGGNDIFYYIAFNNATDQVDGGTGNDAVWLGGGTAHFTAANFVSVEKILYIPFQTGVIDVTTDDAAVPAGQTLTIDARQSTFETNIFDGSAETDGHFDFFGASASTNIFIGGALSDTFRLPSESICTLTGGGGADTFIVKGAEFASTYTFVFNSVSDSTSVGYDTITGVDLSRARFDVSGIAAVTAVDNIVNTSPAPLSTATFDSDLAAAIGAGQLAAHHAVMFIAQNGTLEHHAFLVVDENGIAGYQAGADIVIDVTGFSGFLAQGQFT